MTTFTGDKRVVRKDKCMSMSIDQLQRPESEPFNDVLPDIIKNQAMSREKEEPPKPIERSPHLNPVNNCQQIEEFSSDSVKTSNVGGNDEKFEGCEVDTEAELKLKEKAATVIQSNFRGHLVRENLTTLPKHASKETAESEPPHVEDHSVEEHAAVVIQANFRGFRVREDMKKTLSEGHKDINEKEQSCQINKDNGNEGSKLKDNVSCGLVHVKEHDYDEHQCNSSKDIPSIDIKIEENAATIIQSNFRGHMVRERMKHPSKENEQTEVEKGIGIEEMSSDDKKAEEKAATVIQSNFRGHLVREHMKTNKEDIEKDQNASNKHDEIDELLNNSNKEKHEDDRCVERDLTSHKITSETETEEEMSKAQEKAAVIIQANFRGHLTRLGLKSSSNVIENFESDDEQKRSYAVHDSDEEEEDLNYSPSQCSKYSSNYPDSSFTGADKP